MSGEEEFEVLVSSQDYLKLESRCQELSSLHQKLEQENKQLSMKILQLKGDNANHLKNITKMSDDIKFLSQKGLEMAKTLINLQAESNHLKVTMVENELELTKKLKNSVTTQQELETKIGQLLKQNLTVKENLKQKQKILGVEKMSRHTQISPNIVSVSTMTCLTSEEIKQTQIKNKQLESSSQNLTDKIKLLEDCVCQHKQSIEKMNINLQNSVSELSVQALNCEKLRNDFVNQSQLLKSLKTDLEQTKKDLEDKKEKITNLVFANEGLQKLCENKKKENQNLMEQIIVKKDLVRSMQKDLENSKQLLKLKELQANQKIGELKQMLEQILKTENEKAEQQNQKQIEFKSMISGLRDTINSKVEAEEKSVNEIQQLKNIIKQCKNQGEAIKKKADQELDMKIKQFEQLNKRFYIVKEDLQKQINQRALIIQNIKQIEVERNKFKLQIQNLRAQSELKEKQYQRKLCQIQKKSQMGFQELDAKKQVLQGLNNRLNEQLELHDQKAKQFCQQKYQMSSMITQLQSELERQTQQKKKLREKMENLENQLNSWQKKSQILKVNQYNVKQQLSNETKRLSVASEKIIQLQSKVSALSKIQAEQVMAIRTLEASRLEMQHNLLKQLEEAKVQVQKVNQQKITMEKEYDQIIQALDADRKAKKPEGMGKTTNDKIKQLQKFVEQYFVELACNLTESKLEESDINLIMSEQSKTLLRTVERTFGLFNKGKSKITHSNSLK